MTVGADGTLHPEWHQWYHSGAYLSTKGDPLRVKYLRVAIPAPVIDAAMDICVRSKHASTLTDDRRSADDDTRGVVDVDSVAERRRGVDVNPPQLTASKWGGVFGVRGLV